MFRKPKLLPTVKLKHLDLISTNEVDYAKTMTEISGYKNTWFRKKANFLKKFSANFVLINSYRNLDIVNLEESKDCKIKRPDNIDFISFQAMCEIQALLGDGFSEDESIQDKMATAIAIATFESHKGLDYDSEGKDFKKYISKILDSDLIQMIGLFNWISKSLEESAKMWSERFSSVHVEDEDYEMANGDRMSQFNVLQTVKQICSEFNVPFKEAWLMSYNLVQTNSYANATSSKIQDDVRILKEVKMNAKRNKQ